MLNFQIQTDYKIQMEISFRDYVLANKIPMRGVQDNERGDFGLIPAF